MAVVDVIDMVFVRHGDVTAVLSVPGLVPFVHRVFRIHALVHMVLVDTVQVAVVRVVDVVVVRDRHVAASRGVRVRGMGVVRRGRGHLADPSSARCLGDTERSRRGEGADKSGISRSVSPSGCGHLRARRRSFGSALRAFEYHPSVTAAPSS